MKTIKINVTDEQWINLKERASWMDTTASEIISEFVRCLNDDGNGSDERRLANEWLSRETVNYKIYD